MGLGKIYFKNRLLYISVPNESKLIIITNNFIQQLYNA